MGLGNDNSRGGDIPYEEYDALDVPLGDLLRGERATLGKSLLDVERDLRIKASYVAAIENGDLDAFSSPGFIAGYVRSYARYLGLDAEWTYERFQRESGFLGAHGMSAKQAVEAKRRIAEAPGKIDPNDVIAAARVSFAPEKERLFDRVEPGALGSVLVLAAIVLGIGYGAWAILHDVQRLQFAPVDEAPLTASQLDPVAGVDGFASPTPGASNAGVHLGDDQIEQLYRPQALDAPVLTPRDEPLATLDPDRVGTLAPPVTRPDVVTETVSNDVQVTASGNSQLVMVTVCPAWVRVTSASGAILDDATLNAGETYRVPDTTSVAELRTGNAGGIYFIVEGQMYGPAGERGAIVEGIELTPTGITDSYALADFDQSPQEVEYVQLVMAGITPDVLPNSCQ